MRNILLFGSGPLPGEGDAMGGAAALRTLQFLKPLREKYQVTAFLIGGENDSGEWNDDMFSVSRQSPKLFAAARKISQRQKFDAVLGINTFPAYVAAKVIGPDVPFWADLNGWIMAEMQAQSFELGHNDYLKRGWAHEKLILLRADQVSTVSTAQRFAVMGEIAALGRLNKEHFYEDFLHVIPNAAETHVDNFDTRKLPVFRGKLLPEDAFVVTQMGGFNNWVDEETLFKGVEAAMQSDPEIHFATTGGKIAGVAENVFPRFEKRVHSSLFKERFHLLGWVSRPEIEALYLESDLGVMVDFICPETETGARNRVNEMMARGLPFVTTRGCEIASDIERWKCGEVVESGKPEALCDGILRLKEDSLLRRRYAERAQEICRIELTFHKTTEPLTSWLAGERLSLHKFRIPFETKNALSLFSGAIKYLRQRGMRAFGKKVWQHIRTMFL